MLGPVLEMVGNAVPAGDFWSSGQPVPRPSPSLKKLPSTSSPTPRYPFSTPGTLPASAEFFWA